MKYQYQNHNFITNFSRFKNEMQLFVRFLIIRNNFILLPTHKSIKEKQELNTRHNFQTLIF